MRKLERFRPRLIGSVLTGHVRKGSDIDIHVFSDNLSALTGVLEAEGLYFDVQHKRIVKHRQERVFTHVHVRDRFAFELTVYPQDQAHYVFKSSITGKAIDPADHVGAALEALEGAITPRTAFLISLHMEALALREGTLGARAKRRLEASEDYEDLVLLRELDSAGRQRGTAVPSVEEALEYLREMEEERW